MDICTPEWVKDAVFYQIFPDRFAKSTRVPKAGNLEPWESPPTVHGYKGGDLLGVVEQLDYLQDLGITALYFNPIFQSASNHRYHTHDYTKVDPMLGGNDALKALLDAAHKRDMKVVLDGVFNHSSRGFFQFNDILENGDSSAYLDWFHIRRFPLNAYGGGKLGYDAWWGLPALPKFNTETEAVREFLWGIGTYWLEFGVDGWRLDVPNEIADDSFWQTFRRRCRTVNPECYIVGEIWDDATPWLQGDQFDAVMNYSLTRAIFGFVARTLNTEEIARCGYQEILHLDAQTFGQTVQELMAKHPQEITDAQLNLLGSHDTPRALTVLGNDEVALKLAWLLLFSMPGAPCIYYGDELGLAGGHDPECRQSMPWHNTTLWNTQLRSYIQRLITLRKTHAALRRGELAFLYAANDLCLFSRTCEGEELIVAINISEVPQPLPRLSPRVQGEHRWRKAHYRDDLYNLELTVTDDGLMGDDLPPRSGALYLAGD
jgi:cyclomaltodextrinase